MMSRGCHANIKYHCTGKFTEVEWCQQTEKGRGAGGTCRRVHGSGSQVGFQLSRPGQCFLAALVCLRQLGGGVAQLSLQSQHIRSFSCNPKARRRGGEAISSSQRMSQSRYS